jgi:hypothetical protein
VEKLTAAEKKQIMARLEVLLAEAKTEDDKQDVLELMADLHADLVEFEVEGVQFSIPIIISPKIIR